MIKSKTTKTTTFFSKSWSGAFYNPLFFTRRELYLAISGIAPLLKGSMIDLGCGTKPYEHTFVNIHEYIGLDIEISGNKDQKEFIDVFYDGKTFPFKSASIDNVFSSETFEHIFNLEEILAEINRVVKPGGYLLATCPFMWPEHEQPYDYARYTSFALKHLMEQNGFTTVRFIKTGNYFLTVLQMQALYLYFFINKIPVLAPVFFILFISPIFLLGSVINFILPKFMKRQDLYLNNVFLAQKKYPDGHH